MYKSIIIFLSVCSIILFFTSIGFCEEISPAKDTPLWDLSKLTVEDIMKFQQEAQEFKGLIFFAPPGYELNLALGVTGNVLKLQEDNSIKVKFDKPVYFYFGSDVETPLFSIDGKVWKKATDLFTGAISFGVGVTEKEKNKPSGNLNFDINLREGK